MDRSTHLTVANAAGALDVLPNLDVRPMVAEVRKTGTDDVRPIPTADAPKKAPAALTGNLTDPVAQTCIFRHNVAQCAGETLGRREARKRAETQRNLEDSEDDEKRGGMAEWFKAAVLKTAESKGSGGSNPSPSAIFNPVQG